MKKFLISIGLIAASAFYMVFMGQGSASSVAVAPGASAPAVALNNGTVPAASSSGASGGNQAAGSNPPSGGQTSQSSGSSSAGASSGSGSSGAAPVPTPTPAPKPKGQYNDGTYTGGVADAYYGTVQVEAVVQGGKLTDVKFLQYPNTHSTSVFINQQAMPYLTQEAVAAQSANVNIVSGATFTSQAFQQSLASALSQAKA